jgi:hypothetical protein
MQIAQRGASFSLTNGNSQFPVDRFKVFTEGSFAYTVSQSTDVPTGEGFTTSLKVDVTTAAGSPSAGDQTELQTNLEGQMLQHLKKGTSNAEKVTVSFYVKCTATGNLQLNLRDLDNARMIGSTFTINSSDTWEKKEIVFAGDTSGAFDNDNAGSLRVSIMLGSGSTYTGGAVPTAWEAYSNGDKNAGDTLNFSNSTSNDFLITGFQLEVGDQATDFEHLPHDIQLQRCFRYYISYSPLVNGGDNTDYVCNGSYYTDTVFNAIINLPTMMRTDPSIEDSNSSDYYRIYRSAGNDAIATFDSSGISGGGLTIRFYVSGLTDNNKSGQIGQVFVHNASAILAFSAEL